MTDLWPLAILAAAGLVASSALGYIAVHAVQLWVSRWRQDRAIRRRLAEWTK